MGFQHLLPLVLFLAPGFQKKKIKIIGCQLFHAGLAQRNCELCVTVGGDSSDPLVGVYRWAVKINLTPLPTMSEWKILLYNFVGTYPQRSNIGILNRNGRGIGLNPGGKISFCSYFAFWENIFSHTSVLCKNMFETSLQVPWRGFYLRGIRVLVQQGRFPWRCLLLQVRFT